MARRSDHTRAELIAMAVATGQKLIAEQGIAGFSTRKVAREIGYTVGTIYNVFGDYDTFMLHINAATLDDLAVYMRKYINPRKRGKSAVKQLGCLYLRFAKEHSNRWSALFEHSLPPGTQVPQWYQVKIKVLFNFVEKPFMQLFAKNKRKAERTARIAWAGIHGICTLGLSGKLDIVSAPSEEKMMESLVEMLFEGM